nr:MATE family efflux transporter [Clostridioides difficile]
MRAIKYSKEEILSEVPVGKAIRILAIPAIMGTLITAVYNLVDTAFIGMLRSTEALSAVSVAFPIMSLLNAIGQILGVGAATYIGIQLGGKKNEEAGQTASTIIFLSIICGLFFAILGLWLQDSIFRLFGASDAVLPYARQYGTWMFIGAIFTVPNQALNNVARAETNAKLSAIALGLGAIVNVILDPIFMFDFGLGLGVAGASIATTISQAISFLFLMIYFLRGKSLLNISVRNIKFEKHMLSEVFKTGSPSGASQILVSVSVAVTNIIAARYGDFVVAAFGIVLKVISLGQFIVFGYVQGFQPIASYSFGAKNRERFSEAFKVALKFVLITCASLTVIYIIFRNPILRVFSQDQAVLDVAVPILISQVVLYVAMGIVILMTAVFQSTSQGVKGIVLSISRQGIFFFPLIILFPMIFKLPGLYFVQPVADVFSLGLAFLLFKKIKKQILV